jgi:hypothetical protein
MRDVKHDAHSAMTDDERAVRIAAANHHYLRMNGEAETAKAAWHVARSRAVAAYAEYMRIVNDGRKTSPPGDPAARHTPKEKR